MTCFSLRFKEIKRSFLETGRETERERGTRGRKAFITQKIVGVIRSWRKIGIPEAWRIR